jgi:hypothetical protein
LRLFTELNSAVDLVNDWANYWVKSKE